MYPYPRKRDLHSHWPVLLVCFLLTVHHETTHLKLKHIILIENIQKEFEAIHEYNIIPITTAADDKFCDIIPNFPNK